MVSRRAQILEVLRRSAVPLDDDEIAAAANVNRHYVNTLCRRLAAAGKTTRSVGLSGKYVNSFAAVGVADAGSVTRPRTSAIDIPVTSPRPVRRRDSLIRHNVEALVRNFAEHVARFEAANTFRGPSLYFHERAIARRRRHSTIADLLADERFLDYVYAVLPAWGMHRMGPQTAKVNEFTRIIEALHTIAPRLDELWTASITDLPPGTVAAVTGQAWEIIAGLRVSTSGTQIVAGSKMLHHLLPDLIPPIDRRYTFRFFTGQTSVQHGDRNAFLTWFPHLADIGTRCREPIEEALRRGGFMATGRAKIIDNAIIGFMQASP